MHRLPLLFACLSFVLVTMLPCLALAVDVRTVPEGAVVIDGEIDEPAWQRCAEHPEFVQRYPDVGEPASQGTTVCSVRDANALYFLVFALDDQPEQIVAQLTQRDLDSPSDWVEIWLDPQNDSQTGYRFAVNARGVQLDARFSQSGGVQDVNWNTVWTSETGADERGYWVEFRIPLAQLRYDKGATSFGFQVVRRIARESETSVLSPTPKTSSRPLLHMARLTGLHDLPAPSLFSARPYALLKWESKDGSSRLRPRIGGDLQFNIGAASTLHATVLPDFGQVEQDPSQLNLTAFEIYQTERRQFFLDGKENLELPLSYRNTYSEQLYYSRRIGARPHVDYGYDREDFEDYPEASSILGSAKLISRAESGLSVSALSAVTARHSSSLETGVDDSGETSYPLASNNSFSVARVRQEVQNGRGYVGASGTYVHRFSESILNEEQVQSAAVGGADFDLRFGDFGLKGQVLGSRLDGSAASIDERQRSSTNNLQRVDASHLNYDSAATSLGGYGIALAGGKFDGSPWRAFWGGHIRSPGFNTNDLGFLRSADEQKWEARLEYRFDDSTSWSRWGEIDGAAWFEKTNGPEVTGIGASLNTYWNLKNNDGFWFGVLRREETLDVRLLRGGPAMLLPGGFGGWWGYTTDPRQKLEMQLSGNWDLHAKRSHQRAYVMLSAVMRPVSSVEFSVAPSFGTGENDRQYVDEQEREGQPSYILGRLNQQTYAVTLRASWALGLGLTLRAYAMPFLSAGRYQAFYEVTDPRAQSYEQRREETTWNGDAQYLSTELRSSMVLRWDYQPGSSAYLVWTHNQGSSEDEYRRVRFGRDIADLFDSEAADVVMLKLDYSYTP